MRVWIAAALAAVLAEALTGAAGAGRADLPRRLWYHYQLVGRTQEFERADRQLPGAPPEHHDSLRDVKWLVESTKAGIMTRVGDNRSFEGDAETISTVRDYAYDSVFTGFWEKTDVFGKKLKIVCGGSSTERYVDSNTPPHGHVVVSSANGVSLSAPQELVMREYRSHSTCGDPPQEENRQRASRLQGRAREALDARDLLPPLPAPKALRRRASAAGALKDVWQ